MTSRSHRKHHLSHHLQWGACTSVSLVLRLRTNISASTPLAQRASIRRWAATAAPPVDSLVLTMRTFIQVGIVYLTKVTKNADMTKSIAVIIVLYLFEQRLSAIVFLLIYGSIWGQRVKNQQKSAIFSLDIDDIAMCILQNIVSPLSSCRASSTIGTTSRFRLMSEIEIRN